MSCPGIPVFQGRVDVNEIGYPAADTGPLQVLHNRMLEPEPLPDPDPEMEASL